MKVLFISNHRNQSGWSEQARNSILAMDAAGLEVVPRAIDILGNQAELPQRIIELEQNSSKNPDMIFQNVLPAMAEYHAGAKNVLFFVSETNNFKATGWDLRANLFDLIIQCCDYNKQTCIKSGVKPKIAVIPQAIDLEKSNRDYPIHEVKKVFPDEFLFYTIGEISQRKNLPDLIRAFHLEFRPSENVQLLIKTTPQGLGGNPMQTLQNRVNDIKMGLKLYRNIESYKREILMVGQTSEQEIYSIHRTGDCYISSSHCEAFNIPCAVAMSMNKTVCVPNYAGFQMYCNDKNSFLIDGHEDFIHSATDTLPDLYIGRDEKWFYPSIEDMRIKMRLIYQNNTVRKAKIAQAQKDIQQLGFKPVGEKLKKELEK